MTDAPPTDPQSTERLLAPGVYVDHFRIMRLLGKGGMGEVYLARDMKLGRKVALKILHGLDASKEASAQLFLREAKTTARFAHPHIITIYEVGEGGTESFPYVALEYLKGATLRERMVQDPPSLGESLRIALDIAEALQEAERHQILHRDLKPENVMLPEDGRLRVLDFGLAKPFTPALADDALGETLPISKLDETEAFKVFQSQAGELMGTPRYMAPEQWTHTALGPGTDIWALGIILYELVVGAPPWPGSAYLDLAVKVASDDEVPPPIRDDAPEDLLALIRACLHKTMSARPSAAEVVETLRALLQPKHVPLPLGDNPFRGLGAFGPEHAEIFFGRDRELSAFLELARHAPLLPVIGPSGSGKTSFVQAGVLPRLAEQRKLIVIQIRPGRDPHRALAARLLHPPTPLNADSAKRNPSVLGETAARDVREEKELAREIASQPGKISLSLRSLAEREDALIVLFVDQLEELYTLGAPRDVQESFLGGICAAADDPKEPLRVIFTLRDDFLGRLPGGHALRDALRHVTVLGTPDPENLGEILTRPVSSRGYAYDDPDLIPEMIATVGGETSALPLLQFTCRRLWEHRDRKAKRLLRTIYDDIGGVGGALARQANEILGGLSTEHATLARALFLRLVTGQKTREVIPRDELLVNLDGDAAFVLDRLIDARLLTQRKAQDDRRSLIELTHDSLITSWDRLSQWISESREELIFRAELDHTAQLWTRRGAHLGETWTGRALSDALHTIERLQLDISPTARAFLAAGEKRAARRSWRHRGAILLAFVALGLLTLLLFFRAQQAKDARSRAERARTASEQRRHEAERRRGLAEIESAWSAYGHGLLLQARSQLRDAAERVDTPEVRALWAALKRDPRLWTRDLGTPVYRVKISPKGGWVAAACMNGAVYLINILTQDQRILRGQHDQVRSLAFSPDGETLAAATWDGSIQLWNLKTKTRRRIHGHHGAIVSIDFSPDGTRLASGSWDKTVTIWDVPSLKAVHTLNAVGARLGAVAYAPKGSTLATSALNGKVQLWDAKTGSLIRTVTTYPGGAISVIFSHDGRYLASSGTRGRVKVSPLHSPGPDRISGGASVLVLSVAFSANDSTIISTRSDGAIALWDLHNNKTRFLRGHKGPINDVSANAARRIFATGGDLGTVRLWRLRPRVHHIHKPTRLLGVVFSADGQSILSGTVNRGFYRWNRQGVLTHTYALKKGSGVYGIALSPDGKRVATAGTDYEVRLWDAQSGAARGSLHGHRGLVMDVAFSPDGKLIASAGSDRSVRLWDAKTQRAIFAFPEIKAGIWSVAFDATGKRLAAACRDHHIYLFDIPRRKLLRRLVGHRAPVIGVVFKRDGTLFSTSADGTLRSWSIPRGKSPRGKSPQGKSKVLLRLDHGRLYFADLSPDEKLIALGASDGIVRLYNLETRKVSLLRGHHGEANYVRFSPDGKNLASTGDDGTLRTWDVWRRRPLWHAAGILPKDAATHARWRHAFDRSDRAVVHGDRVWIATFDHHFETWSLSQDKRIATDELREIGPIVDLVAIQGGCLILGKKAARRYETNGAFQTIPTASAAFADGDGFLLATAGIVERFNAQGRRVKVLYRGESNITAIARISGKVILGFSTGNIAFAKQKEIASQPLAGLPAEAVLRLSSGPAGTLVATFAKGLVGVWSVTTGRRLGHLYVHGAATYIDVTPDRLRVVSELGDQVEVDARDLSRPRCAFLRDIWKQVPTGWRQGRPRLVAPPTDHVCTPH